MLILTIKIWEITGSWKPWPTHPRLTISPIKLIVQPRKSDLTALKPTCTHHPGLPVNAPSAGSSSVLWSAFFLGTFLAWASCLFLSFSAFFSSFFFLASSSSWAFCLASRSENQHVGHPVSVRCCRAYHSEIKNTVGRGLGEGGRGRGQREIDSLIACL